MARFVSISDFSTGELKIATSTFQEADLQKFIDKVEPSILNELLGCALYLLFIADWDAVTANSFSQDRFKDIYKEFCKDDSCGICKSEGIKKMIMYFVYFEYLRFQNTQNRITGQSKPKKELSESVSTVHHALFSEYNAGIETYRAIQWHMCENSEDYIEENGQRKEKASWL